METTVIVPHMSGVTTALVLFMFACLLIPGAIKNRTQFYAGFAGVLAILFLYSLDVMIRRPGFQVFGGAMTGLLQLFSIVMFFMSAGGMNLGELSAEMKRAYEVIRRGEEEKTVVIPLSGQAPKAPGTEPAPERVEVSGEGGWPAKPPEKKDDTSSIPLNEP